MIPSYLSKVFGLSLASWSARNSSKSWSIVLSGLGVLIGPSAPGVVYADAHSIRVDRGGHDLRAVNQPTTAKAYAYSQPHFGKVTGPAASLGSGWAPVVPGLRTSQSPPQW